LNFDEILDNTTDTGIIISLLSSYFSNADTNEEPKYIVKEKPIHIIYEEGLENYIEEPFVSVCKNSWRKNLFTKESVVEKKEFKIIYNSFDENNIKIFDELVEKDNAHYTYSLEGDPVIRTKMEKNRSLKSISDELVILSAPLKLQDISIGYMDKEEFLMKVCSCEKVEGLKEHTKDWEAKFVYDPNKLEKTFEEYLKQYSYENLYIPQEERIYKDKFYLDAHIKYLKSLTQSKDDESLENLDFSEDTETEKTAKKLKASKTTKTVKKAKREKLTQETKTEKNKVRKYAKFSKK
jgi:hypothetical protein